MRRALATVATAQHIQLFDRIGTDAFSIESVAQDFDMTTRAAEAMVSVLASLKLVIPQGQENFYLSEEAQTYLMKKSPFCYSLLLPEDDPSFVQHRAAFASREKPVAPIAVSIEALEPHVIQGFIDKMHRMTLPAAHSLGNQAVFRKITNLLDIGGGSAALSIGIANQNPTIQITILDLSPVCKIADQNIQDYGLSQQIQTETGNMFEDYPSGFDGILFGNIFHDWDLDSCQSLVRKSFEALEPGGYICLHEMLLSPLKDGPLGVAAFSVGMLVHELGKQFTFAELEALLGSAGFVDVQATPSFGLYSVVTGKKPLD